MKIKFEIVSNSSEPEVSGEVFYSPEEFSFMYKPFLESVNFSLEINYILFSVNENNEIFQLGGFCPFDRDAKREFELPEHIEGRLKITGDFEPGFTYKINEDKEWNVCLHTREDWIRIGSDCNNSKNVKIAKDCIVSLNNKNEICSVYIKINMIN